VIIFSRFTLFLPKDKKPQIMEQESKTMWLSRNLGFITGPGMIMLGISGLMRNRNTYLSIFILFLGVVRTGLTLYSYFKKKNETQE
jgi:hypothetical protein